MNLMENSIRLVCTQLKLERLMLNIGYITLSSSLCCVGLNLEGKAVNCSWAKSR